MINPGEKTNQAKKQKAGGVKEGIEAEVLEVLGGAAEKLGTN